MGKRASQERIVEDLLAIALQTDLAPSPGTVRPDSVLIGTDAICDSLSLLRFLMHAERHFGMEIVQQELGADVLKTIGSLARHIAGARCPET